MDEVNNGEWSNVVKGGKGKNKKNKKLKNARTLTLQTFFSEQGVTGSPDGQGISGDRDDRGVGILPTPDLSEEELVVQTSLHSFFAEVLRRIGPCKISE